MAKKKLGQWFREVVEQTVRHCRIGAYVLVPGSVFVAWLTYWIMWVTLWAGFGLGFGLSDTAIGWLAYAMLATVFVWQFLPGARFEETYRFSGETEAGTITLDLARFTGSGWVLLFDPGVAHGFVKVIAMLYLTAPRMLALALMLHRRANRMQQMDVALCGRVVGMLMQAQGRVAVEKIAAEFPEADLNQLLQSLGDIDGIVFLEKNGIGLTLAPRFIEEFARWSEQS